MIKMGEKMTPPFFPHPESLGYKPHLRLYTDGNLYLWRGKLMGWKQIGFICASKIQLRRTSWPVRG
jgi:hypothetical protein